MPSRIHDIRIRAEGSSMAAVEGEFALALARISRALNLKLYVGSQVIELNDGQTPTSAVLVDENGTPTKGDPLSPWEDGWYFGRLIAFPHSSDGLQSNE